MSTSETINSNYRDLNIRNHVYYVLGSYEND